MKGFTYSKRSRNNKAKISPFLCGAKYDTYSYQILSLVAPNQGEYVNQIRLAHIMPRGQTHLKMQKLGWLK